MSELTFTQYVHEKIKSIDIEKLASESNLIGVGENIAELAQLMTRINQELANRQWVYNLKVKLSYENLEKKSVAQAQMEARASQEWKDLQDCIAIEKSVIEMIRSLKHLLKAMKDEESTSQYT